MSLEDEFYDRAIQHMKEQEARQWAEDNPDVFAPVDYSNPLDVLVVWGGILLVGGCAIYALFATIFGG